MSDAFRSQLEAAEEKVRRAQDEIATLREDKAKLEQRLSPLQKPVNLWIGALGIIALTSVLITFVMSVYEKRNRAELEARAAASAAYFAAELSARDERLAKCVEETARCEGHLRSCRSPDSPPPLPPARTPCNCAPGDPLCSCLEDAPFDKGAAAGALGAVDVKQCATEEGSRTIHVSVTFNHDGSVPVAVLDSGRERLSEVERSCVLNAMKAVRVPPFSGAPVKVGKTYTLTK